MVSVDLKQHWTWTKSQSLGTVGGRPGLPVSNSLYGFFGRKATWNLNKDLRAEVLCESQGDHPGLAVSDSLYGLFGRKATLNLALRACVLEACFVFVFLILFLYIIF